MEESQDRINDRADQLVEGHYQLMQDLIALRKKHGLSQEEVGSRMGISQPAVAAFESYDSNPTLSSIRRYALAAGALINFKVVDDLEVGTYFDVGLQELETWISTPPSFSRYLFTDSAEISHDILG